MVANFNEFSYITPLTSNYIKDTNWYSFNDNYVRENYWGYKRGCDFLSVSSSNYCSSNIPEFDINNGDSYCSEGYIYKGQGALSYTSSSSEPNEYFEGCKIIRKGTANSNESPDCTSMNRTLEYNLATSYLQEYF